jgi:ATP-dependent DNA ligase
MPHKVTPMPPLKSKALFIEPMLCLAASSLPEGPEWEYELKVDGYRAVASFLVGGC